MGTTERAVFIAGLAWAAGVVDAAGFLLLGGVFTSHMTGNTAGAMLVFITGRGSHGLDRAIVVEHRRGATRSGGAHFLIAFAIPHLFYHVASAYSILRNQGVQLTMGDFLGNWGTS